MERKTPLGAIAQGLAAGLIGNAVFTGYQSLLARLSEKDGSGESEGDEPRRWRDVSEPAQVGQRIVAGVFHREVPIDRAETMTTAVHWIYGTSFGALYGIYEETLRRPVLSGIALSSTVMAADYTLLPAMKLYKPPWRYPAAALAKDYANHLVYGLSVAAAYRLLDAFRAETA